MEPETQNPEQPEGQLEPERKRSPRKRTKASKPDGAGVSADASSTIALDVPRDPEKEVIHADIIVAKGRSHRDRIAEWALMRSQGMKNVDIAVKLGIAPSTLNTLISKAAREGWLKFDHPAERLEFELAPLIVDNIKEHLVNGDKKMTIEAAKGIGLFKAHQAVKVENESPQMVLALKIETPAGYDPTTQVTGVIVGRPKAVE